MEVRNKREEGLPEAAIEYVRIERRKSYGLRYSQAQSYSRERTLRKAVVGIVDHYNTWTVCYNPKDSCQGRRQRSDCSREAELG